MAHLIVVKTGNSYQPISVFDGMRRADYRVRSYDQTEACGAAQAAAPGGLPPRAKPSTRVVMIKKGWQ
jgi:hypothetical protein